jgi:hypothetical protein
MGIILRWEWQPPSGRFCDVGVLRIGDGIQVSAIRYSVDESGSKLPHSKRCEAASRDL